MVCVSFRCQTGPRWGHGPGNGDLKLEVCSINNLEIFNLVSPKNVREWCCGARLGADKLVAVIVSHKIRRKATSNWSLAER